ncbi:restriction endonuclease subunit M [Lactobacillus johnsonii]|uniref:Restriction endonuclease subunit M n=2 Tax=Lactobacillus johnsonii TaxID=33959 RepID=A0AAX0PUW6_LACJH|nr:restriction endonuclease subunit M [Lactobacillus johnsonii]
MRTMTEFKYFKLGDLFKIEKVTGFNKNELRNNANGKYDYVTRTSLNNGVESITDKVPNRIPNEPHTFSLGLLQMTFFYRERPWYAGQFIRKITPKFKNSDLVNLYMLTCLRKISRILLGVLVRDVDNTFNNISIKLPIDTKTNELDFKYMEDRVKALEQDRVKALANYLTVTGLDDYELTDNDKKVLSYKPKFKDYKIWDIFKVVNTHSILKSQVAKLSEGNTPYLTAAEGNNAVFSYINCPKEWIDEGNCVFIGGKTMVVTYQEKDFCSNDSHNLALYFKQDEYRKPLIQQYFVGAIRKALSQKYSWGDSISKSKIKKDIISLPIDKKGEIDFQYMENYIKVVQKLTIKNVVKYKEEVIDKTKGIIT